MNIHDNIQEYYRGMANKHHRYRSWEHCYRYFHAPKSKAAELNRDTAALHLGFYLASWGMYRGSSFLLQRSYTAHSGVVEKILQPQFNSLWTREFGVSDNDADLIPNIIEAIEGIRNAYKSIAESRDATDTLITKVILGTFGCLPACDRYFISGFKTAGYRFSSLNAKFLVRLLEFTRENRRELFEEQRAIERSDGMKYPLMKLVDMYFWQTGAKVTDQEQSVELESVKA